MAGLPSSTVYSASTASFIYTSSSFILTQTFNLQPQTTPYTPPSSCRSSIFCSMPGDELRGGKVCFEYNVIGSTTSQYLSSACYPDGYKDIYYHGPDYEDVVTIAFPGDTCPTGWQARCTQPIASGSSTILQTYCCPSGYHTCQIVAGARNCVSHLSTATQLWVVKNGSSSSTALRELITNTPITGTGADPITVYRAVFPLVGAASLATGTRSFTSVVTQSKGGQQSGNPSDGQGSTETTAAGGAGSSLSAGAIAGVAIGSIAGVALLVGLGFFIFWRRRKSAGASGAQHTPLPQGPTGYDPHGVGSPAMSQQQQQQQQPGYDPRSTTGGYYDPTKQYPYPHSPGTVGVYPNGSYDPHAPVAYYSNGAPQYGQQELSAETRHVSELESHGRFSAPVEIGSSTLGPMPPPASAVSPATSPAFSAAHPSTVNSSPAVHNVMPRH